MKSPLAKFVLTALGIFIVWYVFYEQWILPDGRVDEWLSLNIIGVSSGILKAMGYSVFAFNRVVGLGESPGIEVVNGCNGISAIGLFLGFIIAYPGPWKNRLSFSVIGIAVIYLVNVIRIVVLAITQVKWPAFFGFTHDYSTTGIFYVVIFLLWMVWANFNSFSDTAGEPAKS